jgi:hypothetical protein
LLTAAPPSDVPHFLLWVVVVALAGGFMAAIQPLTPPPPLLPAAPAVCPVAGSTDLGNSSEVPMTAGLSAVVACCCGGCVPVSAQRQWDGVWCQLTAGGWLLVAHNGTAWGW